MKNILAIDAASGISGDMFVAAAAALANCEPEIQKLPQQLGFDQVHIEFSDCVRASIQCRHCAITIDGHHAEDAHLHQRHQHQHRHLSEINTLISAASLEPAIEERALRMFQRLGEVEAAAHGIDIEKVHFHEVGAIDSIIDIVAAAICIERLNISTCYCSDICVGFGNIECAHGTLPIPAPATDVLLRGMPCSSGALSGEWCTPTGALILCELNPLFTPIPSSVSHSSCFGAGNKDSEKRPNALRLRLLGQATSEHNSSYYMHRDSIVVLRTNIDDCSGEQLGSDFIDALLQADAKDVTLSPCIMKKGRPGQQLEVLCSSSHAEDLAAYIMSNSSSIGVRYADADRYILERSSYTIHCRYGDVRCKKVRLPNGKSRTYPEHQACAQLAEKNNCAFIDVYRAALVAVENT